MRRSRTIERLGASRDPEAPRRGWIRKSHLDRALDIRLPIPTRMVSNEEYAPLPQTARQAAVEHRLLESATEGARSLGIDRRRFLSSSMGMAAAFAALNSVFGRFFTISAAELAGPAPARGADWFVLDAQTHHVKATPVMPEIDRRFLEYLRNVRGFGGMWNPELRNREISADELHRENYIKEIFLDSQTDVAVVSGLPRMTAGSDPISPEELARTRNAVNDLTGSRRVLCHGVLSPELGRRNLESMQAQAEALKIEAWKGYPGQPLGPDGAGWWLDDEKLSYPALELSRKLGVRIVCLHKGLPAPEFSAEHCNPKDIFRAALDFPEIQFLVYHAALRSVREVFPLVESEFATGSAIPWVSDLCEWKKSHPEVTNVYMELGSTFGMTAITLPLLCAHILGMIIQAFGEDHLLWGTDAIWWGSPQWQIEAFKRFEMPELLMKKFGYGPLTDEVKRGILGLNAARVYGVDPAAARGDLPGDYVDRLRKAYREAGIASPSNTQYGWVVA